VLRRYKREAPQRLDKRTRQANDAWAKLAKQNLKIELRRQIKKENQEAAQQAIQQARELHAQQGQDDGGRLQALEDRLAGRDIEQPAEQQPREAATQPAATPAPQGPTAAQLRQREKAKARQDAQEARRRAAEGRQAAKQQRENVANLKTEQAAKSVGMTPDEYRQAAEQLKLRDPVLRAQWEEAENLEAAREKAKRDIGNAYYNHQMKQRGKQPDGRQHPLTDEQAENLDELLGDTAHPAWIDGLAASLDEMFGLGWGADTGQSGFQGHQTYESTAQHSDQANARLWDLLTRTPDYGPHQDEWHEALVDAIQRNREPRADESQQDAPEFNPDDLDPERQAEDYDPWEQTPFAARHELRRDLYSALAGLGRQLSA